MTSSDVLYTTQPSATSLPQGLLPKAVPDRCQALWDIRTAWTAGFTRTSASRQATWADGEATLRLEIVPRQHERFVPAQWDRSVADGVPTYRRDTVTQWDGANGSSGTIYRKSLRIEADTLAGTLSREAVRPDVHLEEVTLDLFLELAPALPDPLLRSSRQLTDERWSVRLENGLAAVTIIAIRAPFDRTTWAAWTAEPGGVQRQDGLATYWTRRSQDASGTLNSVVIAYPDAFGLIEVRGSRLNRDDSEASRHALDSIDVSFVREIIARLK